MLKQVCVLEEKIDRSSFNRDSFLSRPRFSIRCVVRSNDIVQFDLVEVAAAVDAAARNIASFRASFTMSTTNTKLKHLSYIV
jgi:hypothetical protein